MAQRPTSVTVVGWILIVLSVFGFLGMAMMAALINSPLMQQTLATNPLPPLAILAMGSFGSLVSLAGGIGCLRRWGWVRYVYLVWSAGSLAFNLYTTPYSWLLMIPSFAISLAVIVVMFLPKAHRWFAGKGDEAAA